MTLTEEHKCWKPETAFLLTLASRSHRKQFVPLNTRWQSTTSWWIHRWSHFLERIVWLLLGSAVINTAVPSFTQAHESLTPMPDATGAHLMAQYAWARSGWIFYYMTQVHSGAWFHKCFWVACAKLQYFYSTWLADSVGFSVPGSKCSRLLFCFSVGAEGSRVRSPASVQPLSYLLSPDGASVWPCWPSISQHSINVQSTSLPLANPHHMGCLSARPTPLTLIMKWHEDLTSLSQHRY